MLMHLRAMRSCNNVEGGFALCTRYEVTTNTGKKGGGWYRHLLNGKESSTYIVVYSNYGYEILIALRTLAE